MTFNPGRLPPPDWEHVEKYPMAKLLGALPPQPKPPLTKSWVCPVLYNQGETPRCVGYGTATLESALEYVGDPEWGIQPYDANDAYRWANANDGFPQPHDGSLTRTGFEYLVKVGAKLRHFTRRHPDEPVRHKESKYLWARSMDDLLLFIATTSPGMIGINWYEEMFEPDPNGIIRARGRQAGGHNIVVRGYDLNHGWLILRNTWGAWGFHNTGDAFLPLEDAQRLIFEEDGEAGAIVDLQAA